MKNIKKIFIFFFTFPSILIGVTTGTATVTYTVGSIDSISVSGNPGTLTLSSITPGTDPSYGLDTSTTYAVTTNNTSRHIYASISANTPTNIGLAVQFTAPTGATSPGYVVLSTTSTAILSGISNVAQTGLGITYYIAANSAAAPVSSTTVTVTYTIGA